MKLVSAGYWTPGTIEEAANVICTDVGDMNAFDYSGRVEAYRIFEQMPGLAQNCSELRVMDFAGGIGRVTRHLAPLVKDITLVDSSEHMLRFAREWCKGLGNVEFIRSSKPLAFEDNTFDLVCAYLIFFHLYHDTHDYEWWMDELWRVLKPGGTLIFDNNSESKYPAINEEKWLTMRVVTASDWRGQTDHGRNIGVYHYLRKAGA